MIRTTRLDNAGNIQSRVMTRGSDTLQYDSYVFNAQTGNLTSRALTGRSAEIFTYDNLDRLTQISAGNHSTMAITYNPDGNISTKNNMGQYSYSSTSKPHAVSSISPVSGIPEYEQYIEYNPWNKAGLIYHTEGNDYYYYHIEYGPDLQRVESSMYKNGVLQNKKFYWDDFEAYLYTNGNNSDVLVWSYWIEAPDGLAGFYWNSSDEYYLAIHPYVAMTDNLGSLTGLYDHNGNKTLDATYDAWGKRTFAAGSMQLDRGFTGHEHIDALGLINMNGRMYDPLQGRFLSPDNYIQSPDNPQNYNRYSYCLNNPLKYTDPSGESVIAAIIIGALVSSAIDYGMQVVFNYASDYSGKDAWFNKVDFFDIAVSGVVGGLTAGYGTAAKAGTKIGKVGNWVVNHGNTIRNSEIVLTSAVDITGEGVQKVSGKQIVSRMAIGLATQAVTDAVVKHANSTKVDQKVAKNSNLTLQNSNTTKDYPPNQGKIEGTSVDTWIEAGFELDRYGGTKPGSRYLSISGTEIPKRSLPPSTDFTIRDIYYVQRRFKANISIVAPYYGQPGMGIQIITNDPIEKLVKDGYLLPINQY